MAGTFEGEERNRLTVLHVAPTPFFADRGGHVRIRGIVSALNRRSVRNIVCTYPHGRDVPGVETRRIPPIPGYTKQEAGPSAFKYLADLLLLAKTLAVARKERPDVIHGHLHEGVLIGWAVKTALFWRATPLIFDVQGSLVGELAAHGYFERRPGLRQIFRGIEHVITRLPDFSICSSETSARMLRAEFGVHPDRLTVVHDGFDADTARSINAEGVRDRLGVPPGLPVIVYTGALLPAKGLNTLEEVIREIDQREVPAHFLVVGYPEAEMLAFLRRHDLGGICTVTGRVPFDALSDYLGLASVAIEPKEGDSGEASGKVLNYMGAGLPVVCFDTENNRSLLGRAGTYVRDRSAAAFAEQVEALVRSPDTRAEKGARARRRAQAHFSWDASAERIRSVYAMQLHDQID